MTVLASRTLKMKRSPRLLKKIVQRADQIDADDVRQPPIYWKRKAWITHQRCSAYQDLTLMDACLNVHYSDTANYEPPEEAKFEYSGRAGQEL